MTSFVGFSQLRNASDLLRKLEHDLARMEADPEDEFAAFDFFITAEHMVDWYCSSSSDAGGALRASDVLLQVVSHVANNAKHHEATARRHVTVRDVGRGGYVEAEYAESDYFAAPVVIHVNEPHSVHFGGRKELEAVEVGRQAVAYWRTKLSPAAT